MAGRVRPGPSGMLHTAAPRGNWPLSVFLGGVGSDPTFLWPLTECYAVTPHWVWQWTRKSCHSGWLRKLFIHLWGDKAAIQQDRNIIHSLFRYQTDGVKGDLSVKYGEWVLRTIRGLYFRFFSVKAWELKESERVINRALLDHRWGILCIPDAIVDLSIVLKSRSLRDSAKLVVGKSS